jgi:hypothetical protein
MRKILLVLVVAMAVVSIACFGCGGDGTGGEDSDGTDNGSTQTTAPPENMTEYKSEEMGFSVYYPDGWQGEDSSDNVGKSATFRQEGREPSNIPGEVPVIHVVLPSFSYAPTSLDEYMESQVEPFEEAGLAYEVSDTIMGGQPAVKLVTGSEDGTVKIMQVSTYKDGQVYYMILNSPGSEYDGLVDTFEAMVASFKFI